MEPLLSVIFYPAVSQRLSCLTFILSEVKASIMACESGLQKFISTSEFAILASRCERHEAPYKHLLINAYTTFSWEWQQIKRSDSTISIKLRFLKITREKLKSHEWKEQYHLNALFIQACCMFILALNGINLAAICKRNERRSMGAGQCHPSFTCLYYITKVCKGVAVTLHNLISFHLPNMIPNARNC